MRQNIVVMWCIKEGQMRHALKKRRGKRCRGSYHFHLHGHVRPASLKLGRVELVVGDVRQQAGAVVEAHAEVLLNIVLRLELLRVQTLLDTLCAT